MVTGVVPVIIFDGATGSGSGTIVRLAVCLAALTGESLHLSNIRVKREKPGLRHQHLAAVMACRDMCGGVIEGAAVGAREIFFRPAHAPRGGFYAWDVGSAGSAMLLLHTVLPLALFAGTPVTLRVAGGLFQDFAPSPFHTQNVLLPLLRRMGAEADLAVVRPGYVPAGEGMVELKVRPVKSLQPLVLMSPGRVVRFGGVALASHLAERHVAERMAESLRSSLRPFGVPVEVEVREDVTAKQAGAALCAWAVTDTGAVLGADRAGAPGRRSEAIGRYVARCLQEDLAGGATVDRFTADQLVVYAALAAGETRYRVPAITEHVATNLRVAAQLLGVEASVEKAERMVRVCGRGLRPICSRS
jgi:RNA 3'-terminal phosphate cyclase (ATP)